MDEPRDSPPQQLGNEPSPATVPPSVAVDLTTEVRWFFDGRLPEEVRSWFTHDGKLGLPETRRDSYRLDGEVDIGVKRRYETILELKLRQSQPEPYLHRDLDGQVETWQRFSPADGMLHLGPTTVWIDVDKTVIKRRFAPTGSEVALTEATRAMTGNGCDAEVAEVAVNGRSAWTFALAAFGEGADHRASLAAAWDTLADGRSRPRQLPIPWGESCSYPEWMAKHIHPGAPPTGGLR